MNQRGFAPIVIILVVIFLSVGIAGGPYLVSKTFPNLISSADQPASNQKSIITQTPASASAKLEESKPKASVNPIQSGKNRLINSVNGSNFFITDLDGSNSKELKEILGSDYQTFLLLLSSPENRTLVFLASKVNMASASSSDSKALFQSEDFNYLLLDTQTEKVEKIDKTVFVNKFGVDSIYMPIGWSQDGKGLIVSVILGDVKAAYPDSTVVLYDLAKKEITTLTKFLGSTQRAYFDQSKNILVLNVSLESGNKIRTVDLINQQIQDYPPPSLINTSGLGNEFGPFYIKGTRYEDIYLKELMIYPTFSQQPNAQLKLSDNKLNFDHNVVWSPNYSVAHVRVLNTENIKPPGFFSSYSLNFYSPQGKLISSFDSAKTYTFQNKETRLIINNGISLPLGVFSPDGKYYMAFGQGQQMRSSGDGLELEYQIYDVFGGSVLTQPTILPDRRIPLVWY